MLFNVGLSKEFWAEVVNIVYYLINRSSSTTIDCKTLEEIRFGSPASYTNMRVFGYLVYAHVNDGKLELKARKYIFLGYADGVKGYKLWCVDIKSPRNIIRNVTKISL